MAQKQFGVFRNKPKAIRAKANAPLVQWAPWTIWDYSSVAFVLILLTNSFYPW